jgi:hypothetical protein
VSPAPFSPGVLWRIAGRLALGRGKSVAVVALDAPHQPCPEVAPSLPQGRGLAVSVAASWTGATLADGLTPLLAVLGRPAADRTDGGSALPNARSVVEAPGLASPAMDERSPAVATLRPRRSHDHPTCAACVSACGRGSGRLTHTRRACRAPPTVHTTARWRPGHRLGTWADRVLTRAPAGGAKAGSTRATWRACLEAFPACHALRTRFRDEAVPRLACQQRRTTQGLAHDTLAQCAPRLEALPSPTVRDACARALQVPLQTATTRGLATVGVPLSAAPIASLFGVATHHGGGREHGGRSPRAAPPRLGWHAHPGGSPSGACGQRGGAAGEPRSFPLCGHAAPCGAAQPRRS